jgi:hypothetical protein
MIQPHRPGPSSSLTRPYDGTSPPLVPSSDAHQPCSPTILRQGYPGEFETDKKMDKKKAWEAIQPLLVTDAKGTCVYKGPKGTCTFALKGGPCTATVTDGIIS